MNTISKFSFFPIAIIVLPRLAFSLSAQPVFQNLNFENAVTPLIIDESKKVATSDAVPGWTVYNSFGVPTFRMAFDTVSIGEPEVSLHSFASIAVLPIQGNYSVLLQASNSQLLNTSAIGQVGQIPSDAMSLRFFGRMSLDVTFDGHSLDLIQTGSGPNFERVAADISAFAGQTGELRFTSPHMDDGTIIFLDAIRFSTLPIPEPGVYALFALGLFGLGWRAHSRNQP